MKVLVTDGDTRAALAVTRSLGRAGHEVVVGERETPALAQASRFCAAGIVYPDPVHRSDDFVAALERTVREQCIDVLLPVTDITTLLVAEHRDRFESTCAVPFAPLDALRRAADKVDMMRTAQRLGVPVPRSVTVDAPGRPVDDVSFPVVVKPGRSRVLTADGWQSCSVGYAHDRGELEQRLAALPPHAFPLLLQERIVGPGVGVFACYHERRPVALFSHRRLRERPPSGGVSVLSESTDLDPQAVDYAQRLLSDLDWEGIAMVEFKRDERDGTPKLMEINGRFWGSLQLAVDAGVDFPAVLVASTRGGPLSDAPRYRIGVRNRWLLGDVDALLLTLSGRDHAVGRSRLQTIGEFVKLWDADLYYESPKRGDLGPFRLELSRWLRTAAHGIAQRVRR